MNKIFSYATLVFHLVMVTFVCPQTANGDSKLIGNPRKLRSTCTSAACNFITNHQTFHSGVVFNSYFPPAHCGAGPCKNGTTDSTDVPNVPPPEDPAPTQGPTDESNIYSELKEPWMRKIITSSERNVMNTCGCGKRNGPLKGSGRIVNGNGTFDNEYPWMTYLLIGNLDDDGLEFCGGSIINDWYILTAAHCMVSETPGQWRKVKNVEDTKGLIMTRDVEAPTAEIFFEKVIVHPGYLAYKPMAPGADPTTHRYDIALLKVKDGQRLILDATPNLKPVCLPDSDDVFDIVEGIPVLLTGWGRTSREPNSKPSNVLKQISFPMHNSSTCNKYATMDASRFVCGEDLDKEDGSGNGDSGGPLCIMVGNKLIQIGVDSFNYWGKNQLIDGVAQTYSLGYYSDVMSFLPFIDYYSSQSGAQWCQGWA